MTLDFLKRYQMGDFSSWDELVNSAPELMNSQDLQNQAKQIAQEIMVRVRQNVATIRKNLISSGAALGPEGSPATTDDLSFITSKIGPLPISIDSFYRVVGSLSLTPKRDYDYGEVRLEKKSGVSLIAMDPLHIESVANINGLLDEYDQDAFNDNEQFKLYLCPDFLHKQNISGGMPYYIELPPKTPEDRIDPVVQWDRHSLSFVNYLRYCFKWGGFPGLDIFDQKENEIDKNWQIGFKNVPGSWREASECLLNELRLNLVEF